ncbi:unnamed protein product [Haemonchus placei]|uniref:DUF4331 domain-containing protein n=1 Tax=Haemonchus placei TaxID=6290 RepID=A0A0N4X4H5_HAEPC|nr:unnamed protein product [Haemonchus placei]
MPYASLQTQYPPPDEILYVFLKEAALGPTSPLTILFNNAPLKGEVSGLWKVGLVRPILKKGCFKLQADLPN